MTQGTARAGGRTFARFARDAAVDVQLLCFPYAGGGTQVFRDWQARLPAGIGVTAVRLPGREQRFREPAFGSWSAALSALVEAVAPEADRGPYALFGHSLGARLAYELTHRLEAAGHRRPEVLVVSACRAPGVPPRTAPMHAMDGPTLAARLREMDGVPAEVLASPAIMALMEPVLRADLRLAETWEPSPGAVGAPILAMCGDRDDIAPYEDVLGWRDHTTAAFAIRSFPAGHFFLRDEEEAVVATIAAHVDAWRSR